MLWVVIAVNYDFTQSIVNMYISAPFTNKVFQELSEQAKTIPRHRENVRRLTQSINIGDKPNKIT